MKLASCGYAWSAIEARMPFKIADKARYRVTINLATNICVVENSEPVIGAVSRVDGERKVIDTEELLVISAEPRRIGDEPYLFIYTTKEVRNGPPDDQ